MNKKAQVSIEYTLVIGLVILTLTIAVAVAFAYSSSAKSQIRMNQIDKIGKKISETSDSIFYLGYPSKATIEVTMPDTIKDIMLVRRVAPERDYIQFNYTGSGGDAYSVYYIRGKFAGTTEQPLRVPTFMSAGLKRLVINTTTTNQIQLTPIQS